MPPDGMVSVPGGTFAMGAGPLEGGSKDDLEQQRVEVRQFWIDATAVTNRHFRAFRKATGHRTDSESFGWSFVLELYATHEAKALTNSSVQHAPHWLAVPTASWRAPLGPGSSMTERLEHLVRTFANLVTPLPDPCHRLSLPLSPLPSALHLSRRASPRERVHRIIKGE